MGDVAGVLVLEDFILAGWQTAESARLVSRLDVQPCGTRQCALCRLRLLD